MEPLSKRLAAQRLAKKRSEIVQELRRQGGANSLMKAWTHPAHDEALVSFLLEANYGECEQDPFRLLGTDASTEFLCDVFSHAIESFSNELKARGGQSWEGGFEFEDGVQEGPYEKSLLKDFSAWQTTYLDLVHLTVDVFVESQVGTMVDPDICRRLVDVEGNVDPLTGLAVGLGYLERGDRSGPPVGKAHSFHYRADQTHFIRMIVGLPSTVERMRLLEEDRPQHGVSGHDRHLSSGKVVWVTPHKRRKGASIADLSDPWREEDYLVYAAYDREGRLRYIGEGRPDRPAHVNSGCSHNPKLNEHFFLHGPMKIRVLHEGLSKEFARAVEAYYIRSYSQGLWNVAIMPEQERAARGEFGYQSISWQEHRLNIPVLPTGADVIGFGLSSIPHELSQEPTDVLHPIERPR